MEVIFYFIIGFFMIFLSVVIVNFRTPDLVLDCLDSLLNDLRDLDAKAVVVDNDSSDGSFELIEAWVLDNGFEEYIKVIQSGHNGGFSSGNNVGIQAVDAQYYLLLNSDTIVRPGALSLLLETAETNPDVGVVSPRLEWLDEQGQESCFRFHSPMSEFLGASQTGVIDKLLNRFVVALPVQKTVAYPEWTSFACVLIKRDVFEQVGLLDDGYFMYFEDVEFCHRVRNKGWEILHNPAARVVHLRGGSSTVKSQTGQKKRVPRYYYESRCRFFYQVYGWWGLTMANFFWLLGRCISKTRQFLGRSDKKTADRQWLDIWTNWLKPMTPYIHPSSTSDRK